MKRLALVVLLFATLTYAGSRNWEEGTVIRTATSENGAAAIPIGTMVAAVPLRSTLYRINTNSLSIVANSGKVLNVTIGKKTNVAIDGQNLFIIDDSGKEKKLRIVQKEVLPK